MPQIAYTAHQFGRHWGALLSGKHSLTTSWEDLVWSAITVGKLGMAHLFAHGLHSIADIIARTHLVYANLRQNHLRYEKSSLYDAADPTEKGATSYFFGMMASKLFAARLLKVPWLFHLSSFQAQGGVITLLGKSCPDLLGLCPNGDWVVVEAKGRTNAFNPQALNKAKQQTRSLRKVNGAFPTLRVATQAYFAAGLEVVLEDPEKHDEDASDVGIDEELAMRLYYLLFNSLTVGSNDTRLIRDRVFSFRSIEEIGLTLGVDQRIHAALQGESLKAVAGELASEYGEEPQESVGFDAMKVFPDGLAIGLDRRWSQERMSLEPTMRRPT